MNEIKEWQRLSDEEKFIFSFLNRNKPFFSNTIEGLSAYRAYKSLSEEERIEYGIFSSSLSPYFFNLEGEIDWIERTLPPYPLIVKRLFEKKNISEEEIKIFQEKVSLNPVKRIRILKEKEKILRKYNLIPKELEEINEKYKERSWKDFRKLLLPFYFMTASSLYFYSNNPILPFIYFLSFPIPYNLLKYYSFKFSNKKIRNYIDRISFGYLLAYSPQSLLLSLLEFQIGAPLLSKTIEKYWSSFPYIFRKIIYTSENFLSGLKTKKFDEKEIRKALYDIKFENLSIPSKAIENYKEKVENELIEIEDPRKVLLFPYSISWHRRRIVAFKEGKELKIIDKDYVRKLAQKEGMFLEIFEERLRKNPEKYLGIDLYNRKIVYTKDIIGILPCQLLNALAHKEGYVAILAERSDEIIREKI
ncbi:MAG: hypothetical protein QXQ14_03735 [Candidatus Aenigmatarchaeota archaeon]